MSSSSVSLYYPHTEVRNEHWLKSALLYWDGGIRRIVPEGFVPPDLDEIKMVSDAGLITNTSPFPYLDETTNAFTARLNQMLAGRTPADFSERAYFVEGAEDSIRDFMAKERSQGFFDDSLAMMHSNKIDEQLKARLIASGFARAYSVDFIMNRTLVAMYMTMLADVMSRRIGEPIVTDRPDYERYGRWAAYSSDDSNPSASNLEILLRLRVDFPGPTELAEVPMARVLAFRKHHLDEMRAFRSGIEDILSSISKLQDRNAVERSLREAGEKVRRELKEYRRAMRAANLGITRSAMQLSVPSAFVAIAPFVHGSLVIGGLSTPITPLIFGAGLTLAALGVLTDNRETRQKARANHPFHYLIRMKGLR
nr:DUF6236 family protein [uncultured Rhodopila sp.]